MDNGVVQEMSRFIGVFILSLCCSFAYADNSDYIWNQQFEKKIVLAESGDVKAQYDIGNMYLKGQGTAKNASEAFKWFEKAAGKKYARAEYKLGYLYHRGEGVRKSNKKAFRWIQSAAKKKYKPAMYYLGKLYTAGDGIRKDLDTALSWHKKAFKAGYNPAKNEVLRLENMIASRRQAERAEDEARQARQQVRIARQAEKKAARKKSVKVAKATRKQKKNVYTSNELRDFLTRHAWVLAGKPAELLPSEVTTCQLDGERLVCESKELEVDESYGVVTYKMKVVINDFNNSGEFNTEYQKDVTLIFPNDPDDPDLLIPIDYGLQKRQLMRCRVNDLGLDCYRGDKRERVAYVRG